MRHVNLAIFPVLDNFLVQTIVRVFTMIKIIMYMSSNEAMQQVINKCLVQMIGGSRIIKRTPSTRWIFSSNSSKVFHYGSIHYIQPVCLACVGCVD